MEENFLLNKPNIMFLKLLKQIIKKILYLEKEDDFFFNSKLKTVNLLHCDNISIYNIEGSLLISSSEKILNLNYLSKGVYILKSNNKVQKISIY